MRRALFPVLALLAPISAVDAQVIASGEVDFTTWYEPVALTVTPQVPPITLPLTDEQLAAAGPVFGALEMDDPARAHLRAHAFVAVPWGRMDDVVEFYERVEASGWPVFVTSDSLLHLYHIQFDETLRAAEERFFLSDLTQLCAALKANTPAGMSPGRPVFQDLAEELARSYLDVALHLLAGDVSAEGAVGRELALIRAHQGFAESPLFGYQEDYSQYVPRGHYTRSPELERYFRAMMWLGRMTFLLKGDDPERGVTGALVDLETARAQTEAARLLVRLLPEVRLPDGRTAEEAWRRIYTVTAFFVGFSDDLTPADYRAIEERVTGMAFEAPEDETDFFRAQAARLRLPAIYSGTGQQGTPVSGEAELLRALAATQGLRLMGQRYVPDSEIMGRLVWPTVGVLPAGELGEPPFTAAETPQGFIRAFPRGLDVMSVLGSDHARAILELENDASYENYSAEAMRLREEFAGLSDQQWHRTLYWSWLHALRALFGPWGAGYPTFMQSDAWVDRALETALASWAALRHDTILYAKPSYTAVATAAMPGPEPLRVVGYVEPVPELYARLLATARMTRRGLESFGVLDRPAAMRLGALEQILARLLEISVHELENQELSAADHEFIRTFGRALENAVTEVDSEGLQTTIVADVHTDSNTQQVLEEGSGYLRALVVAHLNPQGRLVLGVGPLLTHHEFKQPIAHRLTDEAWRGMLQAGQAPPRAPWQTQSQPGGQVRTGGW